MSNHIDLIVPGLCGPLPEIDLLVDNNNLYSFSNYLFKAKKKTGLSQSYPQQLSHSLNLKLNEEKIAFAELALAAYGVDTDGCYWMHADPVYLMADVDHAVLYDSHSLDLSMLESQELVKTLNSHFMQDGIEFVIADSNNWFIKSKQPFDVDTTHLHDVVMRNVNQFMPTGKGGVFLKQIMNESQMLLHSSVINTRREERGLMPVNSLWFWGEGNVDTSKVMESVKCFGDEILMKGIAKRFDFPVEEYNEENLFDNILTQQSEHEGRSVIVFHELLASCNYGDVSSWSDAFNHLYEKRLNPLIKNFMKNKIKIHLYPCNGSLFVLEPAMMYRFWRRGKIGGYFESNNS